MNISCSFVGCLSVQIKMDLIQRPASRRRRQYPSSVIPTKSRRKSGVGHFSGVSCHDKIFEGGFSFEFGGSIE